MSIHFMPYNLNSEGAKTMARMADTLLVKRRGSKFVHRDNRLLVNWGSSVCDLKVDESKYLNNHKAVSNTIDKLKTNEILENAGVNTPIRLNFHDAEQHIYKGGQVLMRSTMKGKDGEGISIVSKTKDLVEGNYFFVFEKQHSEYRVLVFRDKVLTIHRKNCNHPIKVSSNGVEWQIKQLKFFSEKFLNTCIIAVGALGLDFGGVDIMVTPRGFVVLEVNTAIELTIQQKRILFQCFTEVEAEIQ